MSFLARISNSNPTTKAARQTPSTPGSVDEANAHASIPHAPISHEPSEAMIVEEVVEEEVEIEAIVPARSSFVEGDFEKMYALWRHNADPALREQLILMHRSLVMYLARRFSDRGEGMDDVVQQGMIGLIYALDHFDPARGVRFATFATPTIIGEIRRYFRDKSRGVRIPRRVQELNQTILLKIEVLTQEYNRSPTYREIAQSLDLPVEEIIETLESGMALDAVSFDEPSMNEELIPLSERVGNLDPALVLSDEQSLLRAALNRLPEKHREVLELAYFENQSQVAIASRLNVSQMHVSRLLRTALAQLRKYLEEEQM